MSSTTSQQWSLRKPTRMPDMGKGKGKNKGKGKEDNCASPPGIYSLAVGDMLVL